MPESLKTYLHRHIPITTAIGVGVRTSSLSSVVLTAPLDRNLNHQQTAFGGSISTLAVLSGWSWMHLWLGTMQFEGQIVISRSEIDFEKPIVEDFQASCPAPDDAAIEKCLRSLQRRGRGRIGLRSVVRHQSEGEDITRAEFAGTFVAIGEC